MRAAAAYLRVPVSAVEDLRLLRRSYDARKKPDVFQNVTVSVRIRGEDRYLSRRLRDGVSYSQYDLDEKLSSRVVLISTLVSIVTIPVMLFFMQK